MQGISHSPSSSPATSQSEKEKKGQQVAHEDDTKENGVFYLYKLSYMYLAGLTFFIELFLGYLFSSSFLFPNNKALQSNLISPFMSDWKQFYQKNTRDDGFTSSQNGIAIDLEEYPGDQRDHETTDNK